jgi:ubiquinone/menaquinone biosynthesis C-methylase UbiE
MSEPTDDPWSRWLLHTRHAGDPREQRYLSRQMARIAQRVLRPLRLKAGMTLLDVGSGDGSVALCAIRACGPELRVIVSDVSKTMLEHTEARFSELGIAGQCQFLECSAEALHQVRNASIDAVACRTSLSYVVDKPRAAREFARVLKRGGSVSVAEPILQDEAFLVRAMKRRIEELDEHVREVLALIHRWKAAQYPETPEDLDQNPVVNFSERDLLNYFVNAGFRPVRLCLKVAVRASRPLRWEVFLDSAPHPFAPTLRTILKERFSAHEAAVLENMMKPIVESGQSLATHRMGYLYAQKPVVTVHHDRWL